MAKRHYVCSKDPQSYASFIFKYFDSLYTEGHENRDNYPIFDEDHFVSLIVLQVGCLRAFYEDEDGNRNKLKLSLSV